MLKKRSGSFQEDQNMAASDTHHNSFDSVSNQKHIINNSVFTVAGLFLGQRPKAVSDYDLIMSPTSPLDFKKFSRRCGSKVGLSIVDSLDDNSGLQYKPGLDGKNIVFGPQLRIRTSTLSSQFDSGFASKPLPDDNRLMTTSKIKSSRTSIFEIADALEPGPGLKLNARSLRSSRPSLASGIPKSNLGSNMNLHASSTSDSGMELSEDYTRVTKHGPNPITVCIFSDCILKSHSNALNHSTPADVSNVLPSSDFLSFCYSCSKDLAGKDIYVYRGEKAFCSPSCRELEMEDDDKMEDADDSSDLDGTDVDTDAQDGESFSRRP